MDKLIELLPVLAPLLIIYLGLVIFALVDLAKVPKTKYFSKLIWGIVIVVLEGIGPILYFILGRETSYEDSSEDE